MCNSHGYVAIHASMMGHSEKHILQQFCYSSTTDQGQAYVERQCLHVASWWDLDAMQTTPEATAGIMLHALLQKTLCESV